MGISTLAPLSLPTIERVACNFVLVPNNVGSVVALKLIVEPITVLETLVPIVVDWFKVVAWSVLIPTPLKVLNNLISETVQV